MALELPYEVLVKHFQSSYSAARAALLDATRLFRNRRDWLAWSFCQPCYEAVLVEAVARGRISAPGFFSDPAVMQAWTGCDWIGPTPGQIDPVKEVEANTMAVEQGFKTREQATIELTGGDWSANHEVRVREEKMRREGETVLPAPPMPQQARTFPSDAPVKPDDDKEEAA
jgi:capsid protein